MSNLKRGLFLFYKKEDKKYEIVKVSRIKDTIMVKPIEDKIKFEFTLSNVEKKIELGFVDVFKEKPETWQ